MSRRDRLLRGGVLTLAVASLVLPASYAAFSATDTDTASISAVSSFYAADVAADGASGFWRLDSPAITDSAGGHTGSSVGTVSSVPGATSDGDTGLQTSSPGLSQLPWTVTGDVSVEFSFKMSAASTTSGDRYEWFNGSPLVSTSIPGPDGDFGVSIDSTGDLLAGMGTGPVTSTDVTIASYGTNYKDGNWHHVVWTRTASTGAMVLYADGVSVATGTGGTEALNARSFITLGADPEFVVPGVPLPPPVDVSMDDVATYGSVLSAASVAAHDAALGGGYKAAVLADSPAGYWRLDDSSGRTAAATVGADGAYVGNTVFGVAGAAAGDTAVHLLSAASYLQVPRLISGDFSLEFWFKDDTPLQDNRGIWTGGAALVDGDLNGVHNDFGVSIDSAGDVMAGVGNPDTTIASTGTNYLDNAWHYVVFTRTMATGVIDLYVDGAHVAGNAGTGNTGLLNAVPTLTIGEYADGAGGSNAAIDELAQYQSVLTSGQIAQHYAQAQ